MMAETATLLWYPKCGTCQKSKKWLDNQGVQYALRDIKEEQPQTQELALWLKQSGLPVEKFFNTSGLVYKAMGLKDKLKAMSEEEKIQLLSTDGMLVKRPLLILANKVLVGFKETEWEHLKY